MFAATALLEIKKITASNAEDGVRTIMYPPDFAVLAASEIKRITASSAEDGARTIIPKRDSAPIAVSEIIKRNVSSAVITQNSFWFGYNFFNRVSKEDPVNAEN